MADAMKASCKALGSAVFAAAPQRLTAVGALQVTLIVNPDQTNSLTQRVARPEAKAHGTGVPGQVGSPTGPTRQRHGAKTDPSNSAGTSCEPGC